MYRSVILSATSCVLRTGTTLQSNKVLSRFFDGKVRRRVEHTTVSPLFYNFITRSTLSFVAFYYYNILSY